jgi:hypothetical protein
MMEIEYDLHDSGIFEADSGPRREIRLMIEPYSILHPDLEMIELRLGGIKNFGECENLVEKLNEKNSSILDALWRIESFQNNRNSKLGELHLDLKIEYLGVLEICCSSIQWKIKRKST